MQALNRLCKIGLLWYLGVEPSIDCYIGTDLGKSYIFLLQQTQDSKQV